MSTIKITDLPQISTLNPNTAKTVFVGVDLSANITAQFSAQTIGASLYSNNSLPVGNNLIVFPNTTAQFSNSDPLYTQVNLQNFSNTGAADYIITADTGTNSNSYVDLGINNSQWNPIPLGQTSQQPYDGYLIVQGPTTNGNQGNLVIGTASANANLVFAVGGQFANNISAKITANGLVLNTQSYMTFSDGTVQRTAAATNAYSIAAFAAANTAAANTVLLTGVNLTQNTSITASFNQANAAFNQANASFTVANAAFTSSNGSIAWSTANAAFVQANAVFTRDNAAFLQANASFTVANAAFTSSNGSIAWSTANSAATYANGAFTQANAAFGVANNALANTTGTLNGSLTITGNVTANYAFIQSAVDFTSNGTIATSSGVNNSKNLNITAGSDSGGYPGGSITITSGTSLATNGTGGNINLNPGTGNVTDGSVIVSGNLIANGIQSITGVISTGNLVVNGTTTSNGTANITGTLNVTGIVNMNAQVVLTNTSFSNTQSALTITATPNVAVPSQDGYMIHISGKQNVSSRIVTDSYGANTYVVYAGRSARGNVSNPTGVKAGDILTRFSGNGFGTTGYAPLGSGRLDIVAVEDFTDTNRGTQLQLWNTPIGSNTLTNIANFNGVDVTFAGEVNPQKGFVFTPNVLSSITTSLTIDIANTSLFYFKTNATTTLSLTGFKTGKVVEVWLTNTDTGPGSNHTITHGCLANNSTVGATSFTLTSGHSAYIKYFSIGTDQGNTYCQISYS
jgi:hypothetical protein